MNPLLSATRRFFQTFGVAFTWATVLGLALGGAVYVRVPRADLDGVLPWHLRARLLLERLELVTYDWRARQLGDASTRSDAVVLLAVDEEAHASSQLAADPALSAHPWPRDVYGAIVDEALDEGAQVVVVDEPFDRVSPVACAPARGEGRAEVRPGCDDDALRARLEKRPGRAVLAWSWSHAAPRSPERELRPFLVRVAEVADRAAAVPRVRQVLAARAPAYLVPAGAKLEVWSAAESEEKAEELGQLLGARGAPVRPLGPDDGPREVDARWLLLELARVEVDGLSPDRLLRVRGLSGPVPQLLTAAAGHGATTIAADPDGVVRAFPLLVAGRDAEGAPVLLASAPLAAVMQRERIRRLRWSAGMLYVGEALAVPMDDSGHLLVQWGAGEVGRGDRGSLKRAVSAWRLVSNLRDVQAERGRRHDNALDGKAVVLSDAVDEQAQRLTPIGEVWGGAILGEVLANLLESRGIARVEPRIDFWVTLGFAFVGGLLAVAWSALFRRSGWVLNLIALAVVGGVWAFVARHVFVSQHRWVAMAAPTLALSLTFLSAQGYAAVLERRLREFITGALGRALPSELMSRLDSGVGLLRPERRELAVYFSDVEGLTSLAQQAEPAALVRMVRDYLSQMTRVVQATRGQLDKYLGDAVLAFWGAPVAVDNPAVAACDAALRMQADFRKGKFGWDQIAGQPLVLRAGLDVGDTLVGEMGTEHRVNYTVMGETVAAAVRLEALCRRYGVEILVGDSVARRAGAKFAFRLVDRVRLPRQAKAQPVWALLGKKDVVTHKTAWLDRYHQAHAWLQERKFSEAAQEFEALARERDDALCRLHLQRAKALAAAPPPEDWDGAWTGQGLHGVDR